MRLPDLLFWLAILIFFGNGADIVVDIIHGPQPKAEVPAKAPDRPKVDGEIKSDW